MLEATDIQSKNKADKLNVNKHLFCVKKEKFCNIFLIYSIKNLKKKTVHFLSKPFYYSTKIS